MLNHKPFYFLLCLCFSPVAQSADTAPDDSLVDTLSTTSGVPIKGPWDAAGSIAALQKMYQTMVVQLQELKTQSAFLSDINTVTKESLRQVDAVNNVSLDAMIERLRQDGDSMTALNNLDGQSRHDQLIMVTQELDRRIEDPRTLDAERARLRRDRSLAASLLRLEMLDRAIDENLTKSAGPVSERESQQLSSQTLAILAKLKVLESRQAYENNLIAQRAKQDMLNLSKPSTLIDTVGLSGGDTPAGQRR